MLENALEITKYIITALSVVCAVGSFVYAKVKGKSSRFLTRFQGVLGYLTSSIEIAEKLSGMSGEEKKSYVRNQILMYCSNNNINIPSAMVDELIETVVGTTKKVNTTQKEDKASVSNRKENVPDGERGDVAGSVNAKTY